MLLDHFNNRNSKQFECEHVHTLKHKEVKVILTKYAADPLHHALVPWTIVLRRKMPIVRIASPQLEF